MRKLLGQIWKDDAGVIISIELLFLFVILILGLIAGWTNLRNAIDAELTETANAITALNQSYSFLGMQGCANNTSAGSQLIDVTALGASLTSVPVVSPVTVDVQACP